MPTLRIYPSENEFYFKPPEDGSFTQTFFSSLTWIFLILRARVDLLHIVIIFNFRLASNQWYGADSARPMIPL
jgi:hypothetical protein